MASRMLPTAVRRVLLENNPLWYLIGNTKARSLLELQGCKETAVSILSLGCGDIRNLLATAASGTLQSSTGQLEKSPAPQNGDTSSVAALEFHLNDVNRVVIARAALLLQLSASINPVKSADVDFLWAVWYDLLLSKAHHARLLSEIRKLIEGSQRKGLINISKEEDRNALLHIWKQWLKTSQLPPMDAVQNARRAELLRNLNRVTKQGDKEPNLGFQSFMHQMMPLSMPQKQQDELLNICASSVSVLACEGLSKERDTIGHRANLETREYFQTGNTVAAAANEERPVLNPTLLDPDTRAWHIYYGSCPFLAYLPSDPKRTEAAAKKAPKGQFPVTLCKDVLKESVQAFQKWEPGKGLRVWLWPGDAIKLCLYGMGWDAKFDAIDTSNLGDHVGLLNLLTCAEPLLKRSPSSRLYTASITWPAAAPTLLGYLNRALRIDSKMTLPVLGLRLVTDFDLGSHTPPLFASRAGMMGMSIDEQILEWAVPEPPRGSQPLGEVQTPLKLLPEEGEAVESVEPLKGPCEISTSLSALYEMCCTKLVLWKEAGTASCALDAVTPLTAVLILKRMAERKVLKTGSALDPTDFLNPELARETHPAFRMAWDALTAVLDACKARNGIGDNAEQGRSQSLIVLESELEKDFMSSMAYTAFKSTPMLRLFLIQNLPSRMGSNFLHDVLKPGSDVSKTGSIHIFDNFEFDSVASRLSFLLKEDHGLDLGATWALIVDLHNLVPL